MQLCSSGLRHFMMLQSRFQLSLQLFERCAGLEGQLPRGLVHITRKLELDTGGKP